jgi:MerR family transcriptional regulator, mercuric resistance operon regulatory protein
VQAKRELTIGALSARTRVNIETIRYYERIGVLPPPPRSAGGRRLYGDDHLRRLAFIRRGRELGFTLDEIRALLRLAGGGGGAHGCVEARALALEHLARVRARIADLRRAERTLADTAARCRNGEGPACPIVEALFGTDR